MILYISFVVSILINVILVWYGYKLIRKFLGFSENIYFLMEDVDGFIVHLKAIYELETFYGDETLQSLLLHSKRLKEDIEEFKGNYVLEIEEQEEPIEYDKAEEEKSEA